MKKIYFTTGIYIYILATSPGGGGFLSKLNNKEESEGGLKKHKNLKKPVIKVPKTGKNFDRGGDNFSGWPEYIPLPIFSM